MECWAIKVRVCLDMVFIDEKKNRELISLDMVFIDEMVCLYGNIGQCMYIYLVSKFKHLLTEGLVYTMRNFKVVVNSGNYRVVNSNFKFMFTLLTTVKRVKNNAPPIPMHGFQYINEKMVNTRVNDDTVLTGIMFLKVIYFF